MYARARGLTIQTICCARAGDEASSAAAASAEQPGARVVSQDHLPDLPAADQWAVVWILQGFRLPLRGTYRIVVLAARGYLQTLPWLLCQHQICATAVRGTSLFCLNCGHGGHPKHIEQWFVDHPECPTGCGCRCVEVSFAHSTDTDDDQTLETVLSNEDLQIVQAASDESLNRRASGKQVRFSAS